VTTKRKIEIFSAGCPACEETISRIRDIACPSCEVVIMDMKESSVAQRARDLGVRSVPAVAIDGTLADCCSRRGPDENVLRTAGLGRPLS
jgi:hypothetical protein